MESLQIGDFVRAGKHQFSQVYSFLHLNRDTKADFIQIRADGLKTPLEVSPEHMVFVENIPIPASQVKVGDMLGTHKISDVKTVRRHGVYAPVTESGDIVVSGILASSYAAVLSYSPINQHVGAHAFFAIRRLVCAFNFETCKNENYTEDGIPVWLSPVAHFALSLERSPSLQILATVFFGLPFISLAYALEKMTHYWPVLVGLSISGIYFAYRKIKTPKVKAL